MRAAAGLIVVFFMAGAAGANAAPSDVICGEDWITFTATYTTLKTEKDDSGDPFLRYTAQFTFRKSMISYGESIHFGGSREDHGRIRIKDWEGEYFVEGEDYDEAIRCLN